MKKNWIDLKEKKKKKGKKKRKNTVTYLQLKHS